MRFIRIAVVLIAVTFEFAFTVNAQGDGPRSYLLAPKDVWGINAKWLNLHQNMAAGSILVPNADIKVDVFPTTLFHTFSINGTFAQVYGIINPGSGNATATAAPPELPIPVGKTLHTSGFADGLLGFKIGLMGAEALNAVALAKSPMKFSIFADARIWYSGSYESSKLFNLGSNRVTYQFGLPMAIPLNNNRTNATWLEVSPSIEFFAKNNSPSRGNSAKVVTQAPLLIIENHLSHNFTSKLWGVVNLRFQQGGQTSADGVKDGNATSFIGSGFGGGYQLLSFLGIEADYGSVIIPANTNASSNMLRISIVFAYINKAKLMAEVKQAATPK